MDSNISRFIVKVSSFHQNLRESNFINKSFPGDKKEKPFVILRRPDQATSQLYFRTSCCLDSLCSRAFSSFFITDEWSSSQVKCNLDFKRDPKRKERRKQSPEILRGRCASFVLQTLHMKVSGKRQKLRIAHNFLSSTNIRPKKFMYRNFLIRLD